MKLAWLVLSLTAIAPAVVCAQTSPVADAARQERARQKNSTSKILVTNETLGTKPVDPATASPETPAKPESEAKTAKAVESAESTAAPKEPATPPVRDEKWWRENFKTARDEAKRADDKVQVLKLEYNRLNMEMLTRDDIYNKEGQLGPKLALKKTELENAEKDADKARKKITQLEDDLRRSGSPIGWSR